MSEISVDFIRELRKTNRESCHWGHVGILLDHIDAIQSELVEARALLKDAQRWIDPKLVEKTADEFDALQAEVAELLSELDLHDEAKCLARDVEIVRLREALKMVTQCEGVQACAVAREALEGSPVQTVPEGEK